MRGRTRTALLAGTALSLAGVFGVGVLWSALAANRTGQTFYVSPGGNDAGPGSMAQPWATVSKAAQTLGPGDTVLVGSGTYGGVYLDRSGAPGRPITFKAAPGAKPNIVITVINSPGFLLDGASYIDIRGFNLEYRVPGVEKANGKRWEGGITLQVNTKSGKPVFTHHVNVLLNRVRGFPGGGIGAGLADYVRIEGNTIWETARWSEYDTSAISLYQSREVDFAPGAHNIIRANTVFNNENRVPGSGIGSSEITDGNCIIIDDSRQTQKFLDDKTQYPPYKSLTLIENNICADNGGRGVHVFSSDNVTVRHNTLYRNARTPGIDGELSAAAASNVRFVNNIVYARPDKLAADVYSGDDPVYKVSNVTFEHNLYFGTRDRPNTSASDRFADPLFVSPGTDLNTADFHLKRGSPALDTALASESPATDIGGLSRPVGAGPDMGAWEARARK